MKIFRLNEAEWWMAPTLEEAIAIAMQDTGADRSDIYDEAFAGELSEADLDQYTFCDREPSEDVMTFSNWKCPSCGAVADGRCRWNGDAYEHPHGQAGHVLMVDTTVRSFREELAQRVANGEGPGIFATNEF